jgi:hypothetical protein
MMIMSINQTLRVSFHKGFRLQLEISLQVSFIKTMSTFYENNRSIIFRFEQKMTTMTKSLLYLHTLRCFILLIFFFYFFYLFTHLFV